MTPMETLTLHRLIISAIALAAIFLLFLALKYSARKTQAKFGIRKSRYFAIRRTLNITSGVFYAAILFIIWDISLHNVWISVTGMLAVTAIAFFAIWSLVGNILAGIILYFTSPFKVDDAIEVMPDEICGTVLAINTFYTVLADQDDNYINIPNSLFFQKYIRVLRNSKKHPRQETSASNED